MAAVEEATGGGDLTAAKARLEELVSDYGSSPLVPVAEARLKALEDPSLGPFLAWLDTQDPSPEDFARPIDGAPADPGPSLPARPEGFEKIETGSAGETASEDGDSGEEPPADEAEPTDGDAEPVVDADGE